MAPALFPAPFSRDATRHTGQPERTRDLAMEEHMTIKVVAFEVDDTLWSGTLDKHKFGSGPNAAPKIQDNLERVDAWSIRDRSQHSNYISLFPDVPNIIHDIVKRGIKLAIVSRNSSKELCDRALYLYKAEDANRDRKPIISFVLYDEVGVGGFIAPWYCDIVKTFGQIREWSQANYNEMVYFSSDSSSKDVHTRLGVRLQLVSKRSGVSWGIYQQALGLDNPSQDDSRYDTPYYGQPALGELLGQGKFAKAYNAAGDPGAVIKVMKFWSKEQRHRFLEIYNVIKDGRPFKPGSSNDDQYLLMIALELRNLDLVGQLKAPKPANMSGWFSMVKIGGTPLWKTPLYRKHPFSVTFQRFVKTAFHLAVDEIEYHVKKHGIEHRDAHLANVQFTMSNDQPVKAHLLDWGIAVRMTFDGSRYVRGDDVLVWQASEAGRKYTPEEFRRYWIAWMVQTEYEANMKRGAITEKEGREFLKDLDWWFVRS
ncbi:hypothetical protein PUNSTDRAFT_141604 [Punctularia strigosozonata HHB-11173 SS5]|uniref:uncharacterized protein n=1 Tax=Punctularia strigosozonata (strain HHB-11173) TaxID=741275 RepID=UPI0004417F7D|nr:uncharacterized protein PUNSTDRAFT_141604 [Punctularia strigosozonata HHB-11173 SS5]EIN11145.1 hypothetical protein PUNSTDRAFT_141604 [Punctularia strigosozonata HHB-11173 SS5]